MKLLYKNNSDVLVLCTFFILVHFCIHDIVLCIYNYSYYKIIWKKKVIWIFSGQSPQANDGDWGYHTRFPMIIWHNITFFKSASFLEVVILCEKGVCYSLCLHIVCFNEWCNPPWVDRGDDMGEYSYVGNDGYWHGPPFFHNFINGTKIKWFLFACCCLVQGAFLACSWYSPGADAGQSLAKESRIFFVKLRTGGNGRVWRSSFTYLPVPFRTMRT